MIVVRAPGRREDGTPSASRSQDVDRAHEPATSERSRQATIAQAETRGRPVRGKGARRPVPVKRRRATRAQMEPSRRGAADACRVVACPLPPRRPAPRRERLAYDQGPMSTLKPEILRVRTPELEIAYESHGEARGLPVILLHGFPDDARAFDGVAPPLAAAGYRVLVPYLRGYGPTRFLDPAAPRMAQQAAIGQDLLDFMNALELRSVGLAGYDWGGRAACITAILAPDRVRGLVTIGGYNVQNPTRAAATPAPVAQERAYWY